MLFKLKQKMFQIESEVQQEIVAEPKLVPTYNSLFSFKSIRFALVASLLYLLVSYFLIGFKTDQLLLLFIFNSLYFASRTTRRFITGFSIFIVYWIIFDYMKAFPNYRYNTVHIESLYNFEKALFGFSWNAATVTPNEFFAQNHTTFLDILSGVFYLCWIPVPLLFAGILFFKNRKYFFYFSLTFFLVNLLGFVGYYVYPAAPPWYVAQNGFEFIAHTPGNTAGLGRFDAFFGANIFAGIYSKSSNVFAAMPSLHAAYMFIVVYYSVKSGMKKWYSFLFAFVMLGIWFSAVYSSHHYILDVLAGALCAVLGIFLFQQFARAAAGKNLMKGLMAATEK
jgi:inositol phosphorylceramide synthase catalytic subunit